MYVGWLKTLGGHVRRLVEDTRGHACSMYHVRFHLHTHSPIRGVPVALVLL